MQTDTNRRAFIAGSAVAAVAVATLPVAASSANAVDRTAWEQALARFNSTKRAADDYEAHVLTPVADRMEALQAANGITPGQPRYLERRMAFVEANESAYLDYHAIIDEQERLTDLFCEATEAALQTPAPDLAALHWKLDYLTDAGTNFPSWTPGFVEQTFADMARLLPQAR